MISMPGKSYNDEFLPLSDEEKKIEVSLIKDVTEISVKIGERNNINYDNLNNALEYIEKRFTEMGYSPKRLDYEMNGKTYTNLQIEIMGGVKKEEIIVIGAHYDSMVGPGANDNASGVASLLSIANYFINKKPQRTLRLVAFVNEEPPFFQTEFMGSRIYAKNCKQKNENIIAMISLETIGYYSEEKGTQKYPLPLFKLIYPSRGNFISVVGNISSRKLVRNFIEQFRNLGKFPSEGAALPSWVPGVGWSDQWSFWQEGYQAIMITDTAPFRYPYYHTYEDTSDKINFPYLARVTEIICRVIEKWISD